MSKRMLKYITQIVRMESMVSKNSLRSIYPIIVPTVLYTGFRKWNAETNFASNQLQIDSYEEYRMNLKYNLVAIQNYSYEELLEKRSLVASGMIIEKCKTTKELEEQIYKIIEIMTNEEEKEKLEEIVINVVAPNVGEKKAIEMIEEINKKKEVEQMSPVQKMFLELKQKAITEGRAEGRAEGRTETVTKAVKNMLKYGEKEEKIIRYTGITKQEMEEIKKHIKDEQIA